MNVYSLHITIGNHAMSEIVEKEKILRPPMSSVERHALLVAENVKAKTQFTDKYEGATIKLKTVLHNRAVIRSFKRVYAISMRNWFIATNVARSGKGDSSLASSVEQGMLKKVSENIDFFKKKIQHCEIIAADADVDFSLISHGSVFTDDTPVVGPVAMQLRELFLCSDKYLDLTQALYSFAQITGDEANIASFEVKRRLEAVSTSIRNFRKVTLNKVNENGNARTGFKASSEENTNETTSKEVVET